MHAKKAPNMPQANNFKSSIGKLLRYAKPYLPAIIISIVFSIVGTILTLVGPHKVSEITDLISNNFLTGIDMGAVGKIGIFLVIIYVISFILTYTQSYIMATATQRLSRKLRNDLSAKINRLPLKYLDSTSYGNILSRVTNDVDILGDTINQSVSGLISAIILFIGSIIMMFVTKPILAITAILSTFIGFFLMTFIISKSQKYFYHSQDELGKLNGHIEETYTGHNIIKAYNGEAHASNTFGAINSKLYNNIWKSQFLSGLMMPIMQFIGNFGYVSVCIVGAILVLQNKMSFGVIAAFMIYIRLFTQPLAQFAQAATNLQSAAAASERVFEVLEQTELSDESHKTERIENVRGDVEFEHVRFGYSEDKIILKDFSARIKAGSKVAIVGPTGAGKTTIVNLLMRFYELNSGKIKIDGIDITDISREELHDLFGMVLQDTWLFKGSIRDNIIYSKENVSDVELKQASKAANIHHFIKTLPQGYDTILDEKATLSSGQKQLITIARAMIENAPLLILDEATSSVDTRTEQLIQEAMDKLTQGRTSFVIAHRLSTIKNADLILVLKDGDIIESGTHDELMAKGGFYKDLYNSQFDTNE